MLSTDNGSKSTFRRFVTLAAVTFVSLAIPLVFVLWCANAAMSGKPLGQASADYAYYPGTMKNGEMWFWVRHDRGSGKRATYDFRMKRINLETGIEYETDIEPTNIPMNPVWLGDELYAVQKGVLYRLVGRTFVEFAQPPPSSTPGFYVNPFLHQGQISTIIHSPAGDFRLSKLIDGQWDQGRKIVMPTPPRHGSRLDIAYPLGIQLVEEHSEVPPTINSADASQAIATTSPIQPIFLHNARTGQMLAFDQHGGLLVSLNEPNQVARQDADGLWKTLEGYDHREFWGMPLVLADPAEPVTYLVESHSAFVTGNIRRIEGNIVRPPHAKIRGTAGEYLARWKWMGSGVFIAWLMHLTILAVGCYWCENLSRSDGYQFGHRRVTLASIGRRAGAFAADLLIGAVALGSVACAPLSNNNDQTKLITRAELDITASLLECEASVAEVIQSGPMAAPRVLADCRSIASTTLVELQPYFEANRAFFMTAIIVVIILCAARVYSEGRFGITPGRWLFRLRTVRSTLRPCGVFRALTRTLLYCVDISCFVTPLPAIVCMMFSPHQQRLGDKIADTLVVSIDPIHHPRAPSTASMTPLAHVALPSSDSSIGQESV